MQTDKKKKEKSDRRLLLLIVSASLAVILLFGGALLTVSTIQKSRLAVRYGNSGVSEKTLSYLSLYVKQSYLAELHSAGVSDAKDDPAFWSSPSESGASYGDLFDRKVREYVGGLLVASSLFDRASSLGKDGKAQIRKYMDERIAYMANGSEKEYNEAVEPYGFDRKAAEAAVTLQYKAKYAPIALYGADGSGMKGETAFLENLLASYAHIALFYVDADDTSALEEIRGAILGSEKMQISPYWFGELKKKYDISDETVVTPDGFYFREGSAYTKKYASYYPEVTKTALAMEIGEYTECSCTVNGSPAVCFLYRAEPTVAAYTDTSNEEFFGDFYTLAASLRFDEVIAGLLPDVLFTERYRAERLLSIPYNEYYNYYVRF